MTASKPPVNRTGQSETVIGILDRITFQNEENGFTVARLEVAAEGQNSPENKMITVVGHLAEVPVGSTISLAGNWTMDPNYGRQFFSSSYTILQPNTLNGIERYLGSGLIRGIGPRFAGRIVKCFGLNTLEVLENDPNRLAEVSGLGRKRREEIKKAWAAQKEIHQVMIFLQSHNISASFSSKVYKAYGRKTLQIIQANPYRLAEDIWGIGFRTADAIARSLGLPAHGPQRFRAAILFVLQSAAGNGHCFQNREELRQAVAQLLDLSAAISDSSPDRQLTETIEVQFAALATDKKIVLDGEAVYPAALYRAEKMAAKNLLRIGNAVSPYERPNLEKDADWAGRAMGLSLAPEQRIAITTALRHRLTILTGGPGTGKSTILKGLLLILEKEGAAIKLAAPTGRAAKRLGEACGREAKTIHRLLEFDPATMGFKRNGDSPVKGDFFIIDEASMMDIGLADDFLKAIPPAASLLLVGDGDQLPSVGPGNFLQDIIAAGHLPLVRLHKIFRQSPGSLISINAALINSGKPLELLPDYEGDKDFYCIFREEAAAIEQEIISLSSGRLTRKYAFDPFRDIQVLTPMRKGLIGTDNLNRRLQAVLNPRASGLTTDSPRFLAGDKVMQIRNNYDKEVFNGDLGFVREQATDDGTLAVEFDGKTVFYEAADQTELMLAYATTVHKSQGSEFPCILIPIHTSHYPLLQRNLLYTAITRGKNLVIVVGSKKAIAMAIHNNRPQQRRTRLRQRLAATDLP